MALEEKIQSIETKEDLAEFIAGLRQDLASCPGDWENPSLELFLEALGAWIGDMDGFYSNAGRAVPAQPTWRTVAEMLAAARVYE